MEPNVLKDIQAIERLQDEDILMAGVDYSATRRYAECLYGAIATWNKNQHHPLAPEDCDAILQWKVDVACGVIKREWNPALRKFWSSVWGTGDYGLIGETDDATGGVQIPFWWRDEIGWKMFEGILLEATTMAANIQARGPSGDWEVVARMGGDASAGELNENFRRISRKARETVEREAQVLLSAQLVQKPAETSARELPKRDLLDAGSEPFKPLWEELKKTEGKLAVARRAKKGAARKLAKAEAELEKLKRTAAQRVSEARDFVRRCRDFARTYCREKDDVSAAASELMEKDWFIAGIMVHTGRWWPRKNLDGKPTPENPTCRDPWKRSVQGNIRRDIARWKKARWALPFDADDSGGDLVTRMRT